MTVGGDKTLAKGLFVARGTRIEADKQLTGGRRGVSIRGGDAG